MSRSSLVAVLSPVRVIFALLSCLPLAAQGQTVETAVLSVRQLYDDLEYEQALEQLIHARSLAKSVEDEALLSLYEGVILADLGRSLAADAALRSALLRRADSTLPVSVSPKIEQRFEALRREVKRQLAAQPHAATIPSLSDVPPPSRRVATAPQVAEEGPGASSEAVPHPGDIRGRAWLPATVGGVLLAGGGVSYALARREWSTLRREQGPYARLRDIGSRGSRYQTLALGLASAGAVGLGVAAGMYLLGKPSTPSAPRLGLGTDGTSAFVTGRWP